MKRFSKTASLLKFTLLAVVLALPAAAAEPPEPDARIKAALGRLNYKYQLNDYNAYQLVFDLKDGRSQVAFVNSHTDTYNGLQFREVTSTAFKVKGPLSAEAANALLLDNDQRKIGAWRTVSHDGTTFVIFAVQIDAAADDKTLSMAIEAAMSTADKYEAETTGKDDF